MDSGLDAASERQFHLTFMRLSGEAVKTFRRLRAVDGAMHVVVAAPTADKRLLDQMAEVGAFTLVKWPLSADELGDAFAALPVISSAIYA